MWTYSLLYHFLRGSRKLRFGHYFRVGVIKYATENRDCKVNCAQGESKRLSRRGLKFAAVILKKLVFAGFSLRLSRFSADFAPSSPNGLRRSVGLHYGLLKTRLFAREGELRRRFEVLRLMVQVIAAGQR